jgi:predicted transposase YdaD
MATKPYDQAFKLLAEQDAEALLLLLGVLKPGQRAEIEVLPREVSVAATLPDQPYRVRIEQREEIIHIEAQTRWEDNLPERLVDYDPRLWLRYKLPLRCYILLLTPRRLPDRLPTSIKIDAGDLQIKLKIRVIKLWEMSARKILAMKRKNLLPFVPLMNGGWEELEQGAARLNEVTDAGQKLELSSHFLSLGGLRYNRAELLDLVWRKTMIPWEQLQESSFVQFVLEKGEEKGLAKGLAKGRAEGRAEARTKTFLEVIREMAAKRFPGLALGPELEAIQDAEVLHQLCLQIGDFADAESLQRRVRELAKLN